MRALLVITVGVLSGAIGAFSFHRPKAQATRSPQARAAADAPVLPPGWDPIYLARLESEALGVEPTRVPAIATRSRGSTSESERTSLYLREQDNQRKLLQSHDREPIDAAWAGPAEAEVRSSLEDAAAEPGFAVSRVECREKTCIAEVSFPSPSEALGQRHELAQVAPPSCHGIASVLSPPESDGPYSTQVVYFCR